jgi:hypothetical protein
MSQTQTNSQTQSPVMAENNPTTQAQVHTENFPFTFPRGPDSSFKPCPQSPSASYQGDRASREGDYPKHSGSSDSGSDG